MSWIERTELLIGREGCERMRLAKVAVVGTGGVGAYAAEMLVRAGLGSIVLIDSDEISESNLNRQLPALRSTIGRDKASVLRDRFLDINPELDITLIPEFLTEYNVSSLLPPGKNLYVIDAIDTLSPKTALIQHCLRNGIPLVSSMGSGAKLDATKVRLADISKTRECPLAHMLRKRLHKLGIHEGFLSVYSEEKPRRESTVLEGSRNKKSQVGSISYLPAVFGCVCAQAIVSLIAENEGNC